jgi:hypothetical protein
MVADTAVAEIAGKRHAIGSSEMLRRRENSRRLHLFFPSRVWPARPEDRDDLCNSIFVRDPGL